MFAFFGITLVYNTKSLDSPLLYKFAPRIMKNYSRKISDQFLKWFDSYCFICLKIETKTILGEGDG